MDEVDELARLLRSGSRDENFYEKSRERKHLGQLVQESIPAPTGLPRRVRACERALASHIMDTIDR